MSILIKNALLNGSRSDILIRANRIDRIDNNLTKDADEIIQADGMAILPSFANAHTHAAMTLMRGYADDMVLQEWLENYIWPLEAKLTQKDVYWGSKLACLEMIKSGTTLFNDMYWHFHGTARAAEEMGMRAFISGVLIDQFDKEKSDEMIKQNKQLFNESKEYSDRIIFSLGPHAIYTVSEKSLSWVAEFARENELLVHLHVSETKDEVDQCLENHNMRPVEYLDKIGILGPNLLSIHSIWLNNNEIRLLKENDVKLIHTPISNMKLGSGIFPIEKMLDRNLTVGIGTDGCSSNNNLDMLEEIKFASMLHKIHFRDTTIMSAEDTYKLATYNTKKLFNLNMGEIKEGYLADLILLDLNNESMIPNYNLISNIVYSAGKDCVDTTICDGKILMRNGKVEGEEEIKQKAREAAEDLIKR
ncbi:MAG: amidohydrolase [Candidatus Cloacimonetes bacterium]|nr:amidohydrolase [Candidatus Cloacimonadota bacterium]MBS3767173.1 amidohydrolase [Candidatus Cloacimonadota bacterium]